MPNGKDKISIKINADSMATHLDDNATKEGKMEIEKSSDKKPTKLYRPTKEKLSEFKKYVAEISKI